jgi:hypothetical protein
MADPELTISQVNKAGRTLRRWMRGDPADGVAVDDVLNLIWQYRAAHAYSLAKATMVREPCGEYGTCRVRRE